MARHSTPADPETHFSETRFGETCFDRSTGLLLLFALVFILLDIAQLAYRFTLPTEGWVTKPDDNAPGDYHFYVLMNAVGAPSPLQPGDGMTIIGGIPAAQILNSVQLVSQLVAPRLSVIGFPLTVGMLLVAIGALIHSSLTMRDAISRLQMRWAVVGVLSGLALFISAFLTILFTSFIAEVLRAMPNIGFPVIAISLAVAILRYRLFDIDVIIRRTLVYFLLTGVLWLAYFDGITVLQAIFRAISNQRYCSVYS